MPDEVTVIVEGGDNAALPVVAESSAESETSATVAEQAAETADVVAEQAADTAEFALIAANEALNRTEETLSEVEALRKDANEAWRENLETSLAEIHRKLDQLTTPPAPPTESASEAELEIVNPPADETPMKRQKGRKRTLGLW